MARDAETDEQFGGSTLVTDPPFTLAGWGKVSNATTGFHAMMQLGGASDQYYRINWRGDQGGDHIKFRLRKAGSNTTVETPGGFSANTWHHVCAVARAVDDRSIFLDFNSRGDTAVSLQPTGIATFGVAQSSFVGQVAELATWNVALLDAEIAALAAGVSPLRIRTASLRGYYWGLEESGNLIDYSGNGFDLVETGTIALVDHPPIFPGIGFDDDLIMVPAAVVGGANPHGPLGHPFHGPFAGPVN